jgi:nitroreductase/NAD-dependent dihydropyrimidine dehydrogenase PreA subunit
MKTIVEKSMEHSIDSSKCSKCGGCVEVCFEGVYEQKNPQAVPEIVAASRCAGCAQCLMRCPTDAITFPRFTSYKLHKVGKLPEPDEVANLLLSRRSIRSFKNQIVDQGIIERVISLSATAPSAQNIQSTEYVVVQNPQTLRLVEQYTTDVIANLVKVMRNRLMHPILKMMLGNQYEAMINALPTFNWLVSEERAGKHVILHGAPVIIVFHGQRTKFAADVNSQLCIQNALIAIAGLGLGGFYSGVVTNAVSRDKRLLQLLNVPSDHKVFGVIAVGYPKTTLTRWAERKEPQITWL